jgi:hypothetical protein
LVAKLGHLEKQRSSVGGVAITISGRGSIPIYVRRPIRIGVTVVGSRGYRGAEQTKSDAETHGRPDAPTTTMMVPTTVPTSPTMPTVIGK